jgi:hypothetical protein
MPEMITTILLGYFLVVAVALLVFLAWGYIDDRRQANWRLRKARSGDGAGATPETREECSPDGPVEPGASPRDNVVKFRRDR